MRGIPCIVVHSGYAPNLSVEKTFERNKVICGELLPVAERFGVTAQGFSRVFVFCGRFAGYQCQILL